MHLTKLIFIHDKNSQQTKMRQGFPQSDFRKKESVKNLQLPLYLTMKALMLPPHRLKGCGGRYSLSALLVNTELEILASIMRKRKRARKGKRGEGKKGGREAGRQASI